ncbi:MAG: AMIN-like domain-containing (lipo)protein [Acidimicrobiia bacterium]
MLRRSVSITLVVAAVAVLASCGGGKQIADRAAASTTANSRGSSTTRVGGTTTTASTTTTACPVPDATTAAKSAVGSNLALLRSLTVASPGCTDVVTFTVAPAVTGGVGYGASYDSPPFVTEGEGREVTVSGAAFLVVKLRPADIVDLASGDFTRTYTGPDRLTPTDAKHVKEIRTLGSFEGQSTWIIGLDSQRPFAVKNDPTQLVITFG